LVLIFLIGILLTVVVYYGSYHRLLMARKMNSLKAHYLAESALEVALAKLKGADEIPLNAPFDTTAENIGRMQFEISPFGAYLLCRARGIVGRESAEVRGLLGKAAGVEFSSAINLGGAAYPLVLAGGTRITGDVVTGPAGVIPGRFEGRGFDGLQLVNGRIITDRANRMPGMDSTTIFKAPGSRPPAEEGRGTRFDSWVELSDENYAEFGKAEYPVFGAGLGISLDDEILDLTDRRWRVEGELAIAGNSRVSGFGVLEVDGSCIITGRSELRDLVLLCSGEITAQDGSLIKCQLISRAGIGFQDSAGVAWPGIALLFCGYEPGSIRYESTAKSSGALILLVEGAAAQDWRNRTDVPGIIVGPRGRWKGLVYSEAYATIQGRVTGNVSAREFYLYARPTAYFNWLVDAGIESDSALVGTIIPTIFAARGGYACAYFY